MKKIKKMGINAICIALIILFLCPVNVFAAVSDYAMHSERDIVMEYITEDANNILRFDENRALRNNENERIISIGRYVEELSLAYGTNENSRFTLPIYGNFCGPGWTGTGSPLDALDALCMNHDFCYRDRGAYYCSCDQDLLDSLDANYNSFSYNQQLMAQAIAIYFEWQISRSNTVAGEKGSCYEDA